MFNYVCSLKVDEDSPQVIPKNTWTIVGFPYTATSESSDEWDMHKAPVPLTNWKTDLKSGLITPNAPGWGILAGMVQFADGGDATEFRTQFIRDPYGVADTTATIHWATSVGGDYFATNWPFYLRPEQSVALRVYHNASTALELTTAEFKVLL
ncbi:hypothetical protein SEA_KARP_179 [Streptomyces phage Karp]|nr:hypothetical protein SEA_KARP_179 [Streptomyces phage Karp]